MISGRSYDSSLEFLESISKSLSCVDCRKPCIQCSPHCDCFLGGPWCPRCPGFRALLRRPFASSLRKQLLPRGEVVEEHGSVSESVSVKSCGDPTKKTRREFLHTDACSLLWFAGFSSWCSRSWGRPVLREGERLP